MSLSESNPLNRPSTGLATAGGIVPISGPENPRKLRVLRRLAESNPSNAPKGDCPNQHICDCTTHCEDGWLSESNPSSRRPGPGGLVAIYGPGVPGVGQLAITSDALEGVISCARHEP